MKGLSHTARIFLAVMVLGAYAQIIQAILIREGLVVFYGNEISLGAFFGSWLFWLAVGSMVVVRWSRRRPSLAAPPILRWLLLSLPFLLGLQVLALRSVRALLDVSSGAFVPLGELFLSLFLITAPSGLVLGLAFPLACKALSEGPTATGTGAAVATVSRLYVADALGALVGGLVFTFVLIQWLGLAQTLGLTTLVLGVVGWGLAKGPPWRGWGGLLLAALGLTLAVSPAAPRLEAGLESLRFKTLQPGLELLDAVETQYGHVAIARLGEQFSVIADGQVRASFPLPHEVAREAAYLYAQAAGAKRLLLFGGLAGGLAAELLRYPLERIDVVQEDRRAFELVQPYLPAETAAALQDSRIHVHFGDGRRFINRLAGEPAYDLVLVLDASPSSAYGNRYFTSELYAAVQRNLRPEGVFCTSISGASNYLGKAVGGYAGSLFHTLRDRFPYVAVAPGDEQIFCAATQAGRVSEDAAELERRYLATPLGEHRFPSTSFYSLLPADEVAYVRERLEQAPAELNRDARPVTYYLNMLLWGKFSASGFVDWLEGLRAMGAWPYLLPPALFLVLWLVRTGAQGRRPARVQRGAATLALVALGAIAMAVQLVLLFGYQSHVGFMFERVALLNGLFMTGLALGAGLGTWLARRGAGAMALVALLLLVAGGLVLLPILLALLGGTDPFWQEAGYLGLTSLAGLLVGSGYPMGVRLAQRDLGELAQSGGLTQAADNLGGALGGLVTGTLMVPLLGVEGSCHVLSVLALLAVLPLVFVRLLLQRAARAPGEGVPEPPRGGLGWLLLYVSLLVYGFVLLEMGSEPGPQLHFDDERLMELSGPQRFEEQSTPFVHYLGFGEDEAGAETLSLASMAAAPEIKGFAGPLNLLLAVDRDGVLRGARYLDSNETPSYIEGIHIWLAGLAGLDLSRRPATGQVDAMSGATVTSEAALATIDAATRRGTELAFGRPMPAPGHAADSRPDAGLWSTLALLIAFFPVYLSGSERARLVFQLAALAVLGLWLNALVTEVDVLNLSLGHAATPAENPQRWLLLGFIGLTGLLFGQVWCGYVCPFGALQDLTSRLGRRLRLRHYPDRRLERRLRQLKYLLLTLMLIAAWSSGDALWASFDPMQHIFGGRLVDWMLGLALIALLGSLLYVRFWCRYFCPLGALLSLTNRLAILERLAPRRRFERCDLGVQHRRDLDCIRCNRCLSGADTRL